MACTWTSPPQPTDLLEVFQLVSGGWLRVQTGGPGDTLTLQPFGVTVTLDRWFRR